VERVRTAGESTDLQVVNFCNAVAGRGDRRAIVAHRFGLNKLSVSCFIGQCRGQDGEVDGAVGQDPSLHPDRKRHRLRTHERHHLLVRRLAKAFLSLAVLAGSDGPQALDTLQPSSA
jgi:hypothetical protein